jgi:hypothetical protein
MAELFVQHQAATWQDAVGDAPGLWVVSRRAVRRTDV